MATVSRNDFEAFVELVEGRMFGPSYHTSPISVQFTLPQTGVQVELKATALQVTPIGRFYGRTDAWNAVRLSDWAYDNFSFFGKGARSTEALTEARQLFELLVR